MVLAQWWASWSARHTRPSRYEFGQMLEALDETEPEDDDEAAYLDGVRDALEWASQGRSPGWGWDSDRLTETLYRRAGIDDTREADDVDPRRARGTAGGNGGARSRSA